MPFGKLDISSATEIPSSGAGDVQIGGGLTFGSIQTELETMLGVRSDIDPVRIGLYANLGHIQLCTSLRLEDTKASLDFDLEDGQHLYSLPDEVYATKEVSVIHEGQTYPEYGGRNLDKVTLRDYRYLPALSHDEPTKYFRYGPKLLVVYPTPSVVRPMTMEFWVRPAFMTDSGDRPLLGPEWHEGIILAARAKLFRALLEPQLAALAHNDYVNFVRQHDSKERRENVGRKATAQPRVRSGKMLYRRGYTKPNEVD